ncbi:YegP family protein [Microbacterium oxydans]|uniref:YegP family protein n=1 Tax=Microbacterium oxydans TaxID=82380 RepID=UPI001ABF736A|nr:DUF1508 domain-containing protein [Microbacterium oxydans]
MTGAEATLTAAVVAAIVTSIGLAWAVVSFFITRHITKATSARSEWRSRFEQALSLARSADPGEAKTGALLMKSLSTEKWVSDTDRATTASVLLSLPESDSEPEKVREVLASMKNRVAADSLAQVRPGPKGEFEIFQGKDGEWHWRLKARNGEIIAVNPVGYTSRQGAIHGMRSVAPGHD